MVSIKLLNIKNIEAELKDFINNLKSNAQVQINGEPKHIYYSNQNTSKDFRSSFDTSQQNRNCNTTSPNLAFPSNSFSQSPNNLLNSQNKVKENSNSSFFTFANKLASKDDLNQFKDSPLIPESRVPINSIINNSSSFNLKPSNNESFKNIPNTNSKDEILEKLANKSKLENIMEKSVS